MIQLSAPLPIVQDSIADAVISQSMPAGVAIAQEVIRRVKAKARSLGTQREFLREVRKILADYEPILASTISDGLLASWLQAGQHITEQVPTLQTEGDDSEPPEPPSIYTPPADDDEPVIDFPVIRIAAESLAEKQVLLKEDFDAQSDQFRERAFTVAKVASEDALEKIRDTLAETIREGNTLQDFAEQVEEVVGRSALSPWAIENVYRTNIGIATGEGQQAVLDHPLVNSEFPYVRVVTTHDARRRKSHTWFETGGIDNSDMYSAQDPVIRKFWPGAWDFACRCRSILTTREDAAKRGLREAIAWVESGIPPEPTYVEPPPFEPWTTPPPEWR